ncbi:MAG: SDR family oxidoreductase [Elusimicrobia bacterium]|nr:SDR family oxidoreductase [Elusimicrobiota bacterium]
MRLDGKRVLVTGAAKRVGAALAGALAAHGARLILHCNRSRREAEALARRLRAVHKTDCVVLVADLAEPRQVARLAREAARAFGGLDALVNNASVYAKHPFGTATAADFDLQMAVNARAPLLLAQALAPALARARPGKIVNIADWSGQRPYADWAPYCASKAALLALTQSMAKALAPKVLVNAVMPGPVLEPASGGAAARRWKRAAARANLVGRVGAPADVSAAVLFLLAGSDFITGAAVPVDGGRLIA